MSELSSSAARRSPSRLAPAGRFVAGACFALLAFGLAACGGGDQPAETAGLPSVPPEDAPGEWRQFRGPFGLGVSAETNLPKDWGEDGPNLRWKSWVPGAGNSTPVVSGGRVFLTTVYGEPGDDAEAATARGQVRRVVLAYDLETGERLWETEIFSGVTGKRHWSNTWAAPSAATDGRRVFVSFDGYLAALDFEGRILWNEEIDPGYLDTAHYGVASSPIVYENLVVLLQDREEGDSEDPGWVAAFDVETGRRVWRDEWHHTCCSYTTPLVTRRGGQPELLSSTSAEVVAYEPATGKRLWTTEHQNVQPVPSLLLQDDLLLIPGGVHSKSMEMRRLSGVGEDTTSELLWATRRNVPEMASPVFYRGLLYTVVERGVITVLEPESGEELVRRRLPQGGGYRGSLVAADGKIFIAGQNGLTHVIEAEPPKFKLLRSNQLEPGLGASPAVAGGCILLRSANHLYCIGKGGGSADPNNSNPEP